MTKTLQKRFVMTAMTAISVLLAVLVGTINVVNYINANHQVENILSKLIESEGLYAPPDLPGPEKGNRPFAAPSPDDMMGARYFFVRFYESGAVAQANVAHIYAVSEEDAIDWATSIYESGGEAGYWKQFKYQVARTRDGKSSLVLFLDISVQLRSIWTVFLTSVLAGLACFGVMLLFVVRLSKRAISPIASSIEKQKQFVTNAGHEIKTPLAIILANTDALELHGGETKWSRNIRTQAVRLNTLMQDLLTLAKMDEGAVSLPVADFSISQLLKEVLEPYYETAAEKKIALETEIPDEIILRANRGSIMQMLSALLDNAAKYTPAGGTIWVDLAREQKGITLQIKNTCDVRPEEDLEKLFDRFYRGDSARTQKNGGYGIGLSAARAIAEVHGGRIFADYEDAEHRIVFTIKL